VERLKRVGAVLLGKANLHEIAYGVTSDNPHFGTCRNPWAPGHAPGGSSGGSAAAVAAGMAHLALGTDTGGSIRIPASYCGVVGLKPTYGLCSRHGIQPDVWDLDHSGPYGRDARDTALLLGVLAGHDPRDPTSARRPVPDYVAELDRDVRGVRVGLLRQQIEPAAPEVQEAVLAAAAALEGLGMAVQEVRLPHEAASMPASTAMMFASMTSHYLPLLRDRAGDFGADVRERLELGALFPGTAYVKAQRIRTLLLHECMEALEQVDLLLCASTPIPAPRIGEPPAIPPVRFSRLWNMMGLPALSAPCGMTTDGRPIGMQLVARPFEDGLTLRVAHAYARATGMPDYTRNRPNLEAA
jgi:aspartyl-tRNA(Asn)/glutamyl-tRNA(Gln) amidotransferase subunit A